MKKQLKAKVLKKYTIKDPLQYSNSTLYYYYDLEGNYLYRVGDFGKSMAQDKITEEELLKKYNTIYSIDYKVEFCSGQTISFIETEEEAIKMAKSWTDLNNLK